jgi:hypothetical protein
MAIHAACVIWHDIHPNQYFFHTTADVGHIDADFQPIAPGCTHIFNSSQLFFGTLMSCLMSSGPALGQQGGWLLRPI